MIAPLRMGGMDAARRRALATVDTDWRAPVILRKSSTTEINPLWASAAAPGRPRSFPENLTFRQLHPATLSKT
jgi:hypothetical protein